MSGGTGSGTAVCAVPRPTKRVAVLILFMVSCVQLFFGIQHTLGRRLLHPGRTDNMSPPRPWHHHHTLQQHDDAAQSRTLHATGPPPDHFICDDRGEDLVEQHSATHPHLHCTSILSEFFDRVIGRFNSTVVVVGPSTTPPTTPSSGRAPSSICDVPSLAQRRGHSVVTVPLEEANGSAAPIIHGQFRSLVSTSWILLLVLRTSQWNGSGTLLASVTALVKRSTVTYITVEVTGPLRSAAVSLLDALAKTAYRLLVLSCDTMLDGHGIRPNHRILSKEITAFGTLLDATSATCWVFATMGHDLAIPTVHEYIRPHPSVHLCRQNGHRLRGCSTLTSTSMHEALLHVDECQPVGGQPHVAAMRGPKVQWALSVNESTNAAILRTAVPRLLCPSQHESWTPATDSQIIYTSADTVALSEAICMSGKCLDGERHRVTTRCAVRILAQHHPLPAHRTKDRVKGPDIVVLLVDAVSRQRLRRELPKTSKLLGGEEWVNFQRYAVVGPNSGPNQIGLYTGNVLKSRDTVSQHRTKMLWSTLRKQGYKTLKLENDCVANSNMLQSLVPDVDHGNQLAHFFCQQTSLPQCVGEVSAAQHALAYVKAFLTEPTYSDSPRAAFVHLTDGHDDSMRMLRSADTSIAQFARSIAVQSPDCRRRTSSDKPCRERLVVVVSDHGLHYGAFQRTLAGQIEQRSPLLYLWLSSGLRTGQSALRKNAMLAITTPFDVHATIIAVVGRPVAAASPILGRTLFALIVNRSCNAAGIPPLYCPELRQRGCSTSCVVKSTGPVLDSYYAAIPRLEQQLLAMASHADPARFIVRNDSIADISTTGLVVVATQLSRSQCICAAVLSGSLIRNQSCAAVRLGRVGDIVITFCPSPLSLLHMTHHQFGVRFWRGGSDHYTTVTAADHRQRPTPQREPSAKKRTVASTPLPNIVLLSIAGLSLPTFLARMPRMQALFRDPRAACSEDGVPSRRSNRVSHVGALFGVYSSLSPEFVTSSSKRNNRNNSTWLFDVAHHAGYETTFAADTCREHPTSCARFGLLLDKEATFDRNGFHNVFCELPTILAQRGGSILDVSTPADNNNLEGMCKRVPSECGVCTGIHTRANVSLLPTHHSACVPTRCSVKETTWFRRLQHDLLFEYTTSILMQSAPHTTHTQLPPPPALLFLQSSAGRDFRFLPYRHSHLDGFDRAVTEFVCGLLGNAATANTVFVVSGEASSPERGPGDLDWTAIARRQQPLLGIIAPVALGLNDSILTANTNRLVTAHDVQHTVASLLSTNRTMKHPWAYNLLQDEIPRDRSCRDALVPLEVCICEIVAPLSHTSNSTV